MGFRPQSNYELVIQWDVVNAGTQGTASTRVDVDSNGGFEVECITGSLWLPTAQGAVAFTGLPRYSSPTLAGNTLPTVDCALVQFSLNDGSWMQAPECFGAYVGTAENPYYPKTPIIFFGGASLLGTLNNRAAGFNIGGQVVFKGKRVPGR